MRSTGPAAATAGAMALAWVGWEVLRGVWQGSLIAGVSGLPAFAWTGPGAAAWPDGGGLLLVGLPAVAGLGSLVGTGLIARSGLGGRGWAVFAFGALGVGAWTAGTAVVALGTLVDGWLQPPIYVVGRGEVFTWAPWGRWIADAAVLGAVAVLLGFGPDTPPARRALWIAVLCVLADSAWRVAVTVLSGQVPMLAVGLGVLGWGQTVVWVLLAGLAVGFVGLFANVPDGEGPRRIAVVAALSGAGLWLGAQAAGLWGAELFTRLGFEPVVWWVIPEYDALLAALRCTWLAVGAASVGIATWRVPRG